MRNTWFLACFAASGLIGCNGSSNNISIDSRVDSSVDTNVDGAGSGANQVHGLVNGQAFNAKDAMSAQFDHTNGFDFDGHVAFVEITDYGNACSLAGQDTAPTDSRILDLGVAVNDSMGTSTVPTGPGTFTVYPSVTLPSSANVAQVYYGSGCEKAVSYSGTSGTVTITTVGSDGSFKGTFDVIISCAGFSSCAGPDAHLTGSFSSTACSGLNVNVNPTCS